MMRKTLHSRVPALKVFVILDGISVMIELDRENDQESTLLFRYYL